MTTVNAKRKLLRKLLNGPAIVPMPGVFDGYSTRLVEKAGYKVGFITGAGISEASLGWSDVGIMGFNENLTVTRNLVNCSAIPLIADADTGYGNAVNVHFTVRGFEDAGVAGVMIEDQMWPKRCGHMKGKDVISAEEAADKIRSAAEARRDPDLVIMSRTDALATHGLDEAIRRLNMYAEAGADLLFADALLAVDQIRTAAKSVSKPLTVNMGFGIRSRSTTPLLSAKQLEDLGVRAVIYPRLLTSCAVQGMKNGLAALQQTLETGVVVDRPDLAVSFEEINGLTGHDYLQNLESRFVRKEKTRKKSAAE